MILLDTSALAKLLVEETESEALRRELSEHGEQEEEMVVSRIAGVELRRLAIRLAVEPERVEPVLQPFRMLRLTDPMLTLAAHIPFRHLGTLDAIHLATAMVSGANTVLTYDTRQAEAATGEGLGVLRPA
jgi:predicted nucleic acid-binding protein